MSMFGDGTNKQSLYEAVECNDRYDNKLQEIFDLLDIVKVKIEEYAFDNDIKLNTW